MSRKVVEIPVEVWELSLKDAEHIAALHRETLRLMNENARLKAEVERLTKLCQATSPDGFIHIRDIKEHPLMGPAWEARQRAAKEGKQP